VLAAFEENDVQAAVSVRCDTAEPLALGKNRFEPWVVEGKQRVVADRPLATLPPMPPPQDPWADAAAATAAPFLPASFPRGRAQIVIGEWGPIDPRAPALLPVALPGSGGAAFRVLGAGSEFRVTSVSSGLVAEPAAGKAPATVRVSRRPGTGGGDSLVPFDLKVRVGERDLAAKGTLLAARWDLRWWAWTKDPREDAAAHAALLATPPASRATADALDFVWAAGPAPDGKAPADRFATVAETTLTLPAGTWRLRTVSDDGIRVLVDGKPAIEDWTWHGPKEHVVELSLAAGPHPVRVEHFDLDGPATLRLAVEPVR
jgi:hypothetical protein